MHLVSTLVRELEPFRIRASGPMSALTGYGIFFRDTPSPSKDGQPQAGKMTALRSKPHLIALIVASMDIADCCLLSMA